MTFSCLPPPAASTRSNSGTLVTQLTTASVLPPASIGASAGGSTLRSSIFAASPLLAASTSGSVELEEEERAVPPFGPFLGFGQIARPAGHAEDRIGLLGVDRH